MRGPLRRPLPSRASVFTLACATVLCVGCAADAPTRTRTNLSTVTLEVSRPTAAPPGGDGPTTYRLVLVREDRRDEIALDAIGWIERSSDVVVLTRDGTLRRVSHELERSVLDVNVASAPVVSPRDADRFAWACQTGELKVFDGRQTSTVTSGLLSAGALRFGPDGEALFFVNAVNGGVAGLWVAHIGDEPRCLSNCALRTGQPFDGYVPPPLSAEALRFDGDEVHWSIGDGVEERVRWR